MESHLFVCQLSIDRSISIRTSLNISLVTSIKVHLKNTASVHLASGALSSDLSRINNILENGILNSCKSTRARSQSLRLLRTCVTLAENVTLSNNDHVTSRKFLLQLSHETCLDLLEGLLEFEWDVNDNGFEPRAAVNLLGRSDVEVTKGRLQFGGGHLEVEELLGNLSLELIRLLNIKIQIRK